MMPKQALQKSSLFFDLLFRFLKDCHHYPPPLQLSLPDTVLVTCVDQWIKKIQATWCAKMSLPLETKHSMHSTNASSMMIRHPPTPPPKV